jgi:hypothetical protein
MNFGQLISKEWVLREVDNKIKTNQLTVFKEVSMISIKTMTSTSKINPSNSNFQSHNKDIIQMREGISIIYKFL